MSLVVKIDRAKLHTDPITGQQEVKFAGSISIEPYTYPADVDESVVARSLVDGIEQKLKKVKRVRKPQQE